MAHEQDGRSSRRRVKDRLKGAAAGWADPQLETVQQLLRVAVVLVGLALVVALVCLSMLPAGGTA